MKRKLGIFGSRLKAYRLKRKLSQETLAEKLGLKQKQISDLERSHKDVRLSTVLMMCEALNVSFDSLMGEK